MTAPEIKFWRAALPELFILGNITNLFCWAPADCKSTAAVNCVTPAAAKTRIFDQMTEEHINYMLSKIPRNKFAKVEELASLVTWLASEENSFSTAAIFDLSGGRATY